MHTIKANGSRLTILHQRSFEEIHHKPHITRWVGYADGETMAMWAVYYLLGKQSRIRSGLHVTLPGAVKQATHITNHNRTAQRFLHGG